MKNNPLNIKKIIPQYYNIIVISCLFAYAILIGVFIYNNIYKTVFANTEIQTNNQTPKQIMKQEAYQKLTDELKKQEDQKEKITPVQIFITTNTSDSTSSQSIDNIPSIPKTQ